LFEAPDVLADGLVVDAEYGADGELAAVGEARYLVCVCQHGVIDAPHVHGVCGFEVCRCDV
jgi:hypothetical protein